MLNALTEAEKMEFKPLVHEIGFRRLQPDDPRAGKPKSSRDTRPFLMEGMCTERFNMSVTTSRFSPLLLQRRMVPTLSATSLEILRTMRCERSIGSSRRKVTQCTTARCGSRSMPRIPWLASRTPFSPQKAKGRISRAALLARRIRPDRLREVEGETRGRVGRALHATL